MKDGTIFAVPKEHASNELYNIADEVIELVTGSNLVHCGQYVRGFVYDDTLEINGLHIKSGVRRRKTADVDFSAYELYEYKTDLSGEEAYAMWLFWEWMVEQKFPYGIGRLLSLAIVRPTRSFWERVGWIPFQDSLKEVCSTSLSEVSEFAKRELMPGHSDETFVPGDIRSSPILERVQ